MSQNNTKIWEINGLELCLDLEDADVMERYEDAFADMTQAEKTLPKDGKASDRIRAYCNIFRELFKKIFNESDAEKLFTGIPTSAAEYEKIYSSFLDFVAVQTQASVERRSNFVSKYRPINRQQKRAAAKKK